MLCLSDIHIENKMYAYARLFLIIYSFLRVCVCVCVWVFGGDGWKLNCLVYLISNKGIEKIELFPKFQQVIYSALSL